VPAQRTTRCVAMTFAGMLAGVCSGAVWADVDALPKPAANEVTRADVPNLATHNAPGFRTDMTELIYRRWASRGRADVGVGIGSVALVARANGVLPGGPTDGAAPSAGAGALLMLG